MDTPVINARAAGAVPAQPQNVDNANTYGVQPVFVKESELNTITGLLPGTELYRQALGQGNLNEQRTNFVQLISARQRGFSHTPNVLDQYANYTYHIRWSITDDIAGASVKSNKDFQNIPKIVIAESGQTAGFNIVDFELENLCAPNDKTRTTLNVSWKMTLKEPYGLSLVDKIYSASRAMGVKNHLTNSSFIELWFTGYKEDGSIATTELQSNQYKLMRVNVTKMESETAAEGTTYRLEGIFDNMFGNSDHIEIIPGGMNIGPCITIESFFTGLELEMNRQQASLEYDFTKRVEYKIQVPEWMKSWRFSRTPESSQRSNSIDVKDAKNVSSPTISLSRGMDMSTILYFVISMTEQGQKFVAGQNRQPNSTPIAQSGRSTNSISANGMANLLLVHTKSEIIGFDYITNDYVRRVTYTFTEYPTARAMIDQSNANAAQQPPQQADRERSLSQSGRYRKAYEYIYTGRNTDVIRLDIKLEWFWQSPIPGQLGENVYSNWSPPPQLNQKGVAVDIISQYRDARARLVRAQATLERANTALKQRNNPNPESAAEDVETAKKSIESIKQEIAAFGKDNAARQFQILWDNKSPGNQVEANATAANADRQLQLGNRSLLNNPDVARDLANRQLWKQKTSDPRFNLFLEDVIPVAIENPLPVSFRPNSGPLNQTTTGGGDGARPENSSANQGPGSLPRGRSLVASVLNDVTSSPYFAQVDLEIRGDPYWIGIGNIEENRLIGNGNQPTPTTTDAAWFFNGELGFFLTFRTGEAPSEETGFMTFDSSAIAFTGLYNVMSVRSVFAGGKFTQTLKAIRDNLYLPSSAQAAASGGAAP